MALTLLQVETLLTAAGSRLYGGEAVSQLQHALQAATLAQADGAADSLIVASLLHDLGHVLFEQGDDDLAQGEDDLHQYRILPFLRGLFDDVVLAPIGLHVEAKRYLCWQNTAYRSSLSAASQASLALQGGPMSDIEAADFIARPHAQAALALRRYDDAAKDPTASTPALIHFMPLLHALAGQA
ncbi:phosphohydrolase [Chitinimonas sp. DQS-5]|uniref:Phosphohydrolase n=1 Tax=Parachitinimonas caeni TaxID=3031301 RepID=A0ABT7E015_9NEIS|nr:phosphonate degradation HD-domain oxygenase [Parachitinimonas caeni]MDK2125594.1 phosphohydrolase [Parachitinimonas caeni]